MVRQMFATFINECFESYKEKDVSEVKDKFGLVWAAFASKVIRTVDGDISLSWREISAELARVFNDWFSVSFTTDAFLKAFDHRTPLGASPEYDEVLTKISEHEMCIGIFIVNQPSLVSGTMDIGISETNVMTGEVKYYRQHWENGKPKSKTEIGVEDYDKICFGG